VSLLRSYGAKPAVRFQGHRLADLRYSVPICNTESPRHWQCTKVYGHRGDHVAHCTDDHTGLPDEIVDVWPNKRETGR
jgi:hypothetical protein